MRLVLFVEPEPALTVLAVLEMVLAIVYYRVGRRGPGVAALGR